MNLHIWGKRGLTAGLLAALLLCVSGLNAAAYSDMQADRSYTYDQEGKAVYIPDAYDYAGPIALESQGIPARNPQDLYIAQTGELFIADTDNSRILIYDEAYRLVQEISQIRGPDGQMSTLNKPEGLYVYPDGRLLIADTQNHRIVRCDRQGNADALIGKPSGMTGVSDESEFLPVKLACDSVGRINVVATNVNFGIIQLDANGVFLSYIGAPSVQPDWFTLFWRRFSTEAQKEQMVQFIATEYSNIYVDDQDFLWGTIRTLDTDALRNAISSRDKSGQTTPIRKLNSMGNDILKRNGQYAPLGDLSFEDTPSRIVDLAVGPGGIYSLLDSTQGHVFTYDSNGNLLYVFGSYGLREANFQQPSAISYIGDQIAVLDAGLGRIQLFDPTGYGDLVLEAVEQQYQGNFSEANHLWTQIAAQNANFEYAFQGLGSAQLSEKNFQGAMESFEYANDPQGYSDAFKMYRRQVMQNCFPVIFGVIIAVICLLILQAVIRKFYRYYKGD